MLLFSLSLPKSLGLHGLKRQPSARHLQHLSSISPDPACSLVTSRYGTSTPQTRRSSELKIRWKDE